MEEKLRFVYEYERDHPNQTRLEIEEAVLGLREAHMRWGPRKLKRILERDQPGQAWPATSTIGEIVKLLEDWPHPR